MEQFDLSRLKGRSAFPFETVAVAISFSPRLEALLSETKRIAETLKASMVLIHVGGRTKEKEARLEKLLVKLGIDEKKCRITWEDGEPVETILKLCKLYVVDLLIIGALKKENLFKFYLGSVARKISRKAKCSVMLLTDPKEEAHAVRRFVVNGADHPKTLYTLNTALYLAKSFGVKEITLARETHIPGLAMTMAEDSTAPETSKMKKEFEKDQEMGLNAIVDKCNAGDVRINERFIKGKPGFAIRNFAESKKADLLMVNSPDKKMRLIDRIFTHDLEYILEDLPCDVLIVHSRI